MKLNDKVYNALKFVALVLLPACSAAYVAFGQIWDLPNVEQVVGSLTAIDTFLGLLLKASTSSYNKEAIDGDFVVNKVDGVVYPALNVNRSSIEELASKDQVRLQVVSGVDTSATDAEDKLAQ